MNTYPPRRLRYIVLALVSIFVIFTLLPSYTKQSIAHSANKLQSAKRIQHVFDRETDADKRIRLDRQKQVREAFQHAWKGYKDNAWMHDELKPLSGGHKDPFVGWAATLVDGLDALYIMGLHDEFENAVKAVEFINFSRPNSERVPVFEVTIRYLGGLLSAYDISGAKYPLLLKKADELGELLYESFKTPTGIPVPYFWWDKPTDHLTGENGVLVAQIGSLSLEFTRLAQLTGKKKYYEAISKITGYLEEGQRKTQIPGLWPSQVDTTGPSFDGSAFTLGAWADSLYEYLPKVCRRSPVAPFRIGTILLIC